MWQEIFRPESAFSADSSTVSVSKYLLSQYKFIWKFVWQRIVTNRHPLRAIICISICVHVKNPRYWQPHCCLDTWRHCIHWNGKCCYCLDTWRHCTHNGMGMLLLFRHMMTLLALKWEMLLLFGHMKTLYTQWNGKCCYIIVWTHENTAHTGMGNQMLLLWLP